MRKLGCLMLAATAVAGCHPSYSPDDYATNAVQQANKVDQAVVVGFRQIVIRPDGTTGTVTGGAAGGILGGAAGSPNTMTTALGAVGGTLVGGLVGSGVEKATGNTPAVEYVVRKKDGSLMSVVQKDEKPLNIGQRVLLIAGNQARIVPDYTVTIAEPAPPPKAETAKTEEHAPPPAAPSSPPPSVTAAPVPDQSPPAPAPSSAAPPATSSQGTESSSQPSPSSSGDSSSSANTAGQTSSNGGTPAGQ